MSGNLAGTYQSFLTRCLGGVRREQETARELMMVTKQLEALEKKGKALGLPDGWGNKVAGELAESYRKGMEAFEKEGDVYVLMPPLKSLVRHREEILKQREEELNRQHEHEAAALEVQLAKAASILQEAEQAVLAAEKEAEEAKEAKKDAEAQFKKEGGEKDGGGCMLQLGFLVCLLIAAVMYARGDRTVFAWLVFVPLALLIVFHLRKKVQEDNKKGMLKKLEEEAEKAAAMLKQRKEEVEKAKAALREYACQHQDLVNYTIDPEKCKGCTACARKCPANAISGERQKPHAIDQDKCVKCGKCFATCKFGAIICK